MLDRRLAHRPEGRLDIVSTLRHFAIITYALPAERLAAHVPDRFAIDSFPIDGRRLALVSVVPFIDDDFHFARLPVVKASFCQTNFRAYVTDRKTGEPAAWFFGTTLGSWLVNPARWLWGIPWHRARYRCQYDYDDHAGRYRDFRCEIRSSWCDGVVDLVDSGVGAGVLPGFASHDEMVLVLTHPVQGFFFRLDGSLGTYSVAHPVLELTHAEPRALYFSVFERLGLLDRSEMMRPHSALICPRTVFHIYMPPRRIG